MNTIKSIAREVRKWTEQQAEDVGDDPKDLTGWCAIASGKLFTELKVAGYNPEIHMYEGSAFSHCFVVVEDHVVDVTATQFKGFSKKPVVVEHFRIAEQHEFYQSEQVFTNVKALYKHQKRNGWPADQIVFLK